MSWFYTLRLKVLAIVLAAILTVIGLVSIAALPAWPVVVGAVAAVALVVNQTASRLSQATCWSCGADISSEPVCEHGASCPGCGAINQPPKLARAKSTNDKA